MYARRKQHTACIMTLLATAIALCSIAHGQECATSQACFPWSMGGPSCRRGGRMNLRFVLDTAAENGWGTSKTPSAVYGFCPVVDKVQSFTLNSAPFLATSYKTKDADDKTKYHLTRTLDKNYLSVYGFGDKNNTVRPNKGKSKGSVVIAQNGSTMCGGYRSVAVATVLVLEVGLHRGLFNYAEVSQDGIVSIPNPEYNETLCKEHATDPPNPEIPVVNYCDENITTIGQVKLVEPMKTGFVPTCGYHPETGYSCMFDDSPEVVCIGDRPSMMNCARCYSSAEDLGTSASLQVFASYYGTDSKKQTLISGGNNPINFARFARPNMLGDIGNKMQSLWNGNLSDLGLPNWLD